MSNKPIIRKFGHSQRSSITITGETRTKQSMLAETDINNIMAKYSQTGLINWVNRTQPSYGETDGTTYHEAMNLVLDAQEAFSELPSNIRQRFSNDPQQFLTFMGDKNNQNEAQELGLVYTPAPKIEDSLRISEAETAPKDGP